MNEPNPETPVETKSKKGFFKELFSYIFFAVIIVVPIRMFIMQPFIVNGSSMDTTFASGQYLIIDEVSYRFNEPARGDVIVFKYPKNPKIYYIKRIIGLPNDTVLINNSVVTIINEANPDGFIMSEQYTHSPTIGNATTELGDNEYFVMGDNRLVSADSRYWGALPRKNIVGKPILRLFPFSMIDYKPGLLQNFQ